jgi:DNA-binding transcriptional ArsR family regulator
VEYTADVASVAAAIGNEARAAILDRLMDGTAQPAGVLATDAGVATSTASAHLDTLVRAGLLRAERRGRQRRYRIRGPEVAAAIEALAAVAPRRRVTSLRRVNASARLRAARTCYDHLAGRLGVALADGLVHTGTLRVRGQEFVLTREGRRDVDALGIDVEAARARKRAFAPTCLDWTEQRVHVAGALGAALCQRLIDLGWVRRTGSGRAVTLTPEGATGVRSRWGIEPDRPEA